MTNKQADNIESGTKRMKRLAVEAWCIEGGALSACRTRERTISMSVEGRLPMVLCEPQIQALRTVGRKLDCRLADVLFAVFGMAVRGGAILSTLGSLLMLAPEMLNGSFRDTKNCLAYAVRIPERVLRDPVKGGTDNAAEFTIYPDEITFPDTMVRAAFICTSRRQEESMCQLGQSRLAGPTTRSAFDLVIEVTEFDHHVLIECFFCPKHIAQHRVARLLFDYARGLQDVEALDLSTVRRTADCGR